MGLLRGLGDTRVPMLVSVVGFWCVGTPISLLLAFGADLGAVGLWWGFVAALMIVAAVLLTRLKRMEHHELRRIVIDEHRAPAGSDGAVSN